MHYVIFIPDAEGYDAAGQLASVGLGSLVDKYIGPASENSMIGEQHGRLVRFDDVSRPERNATPGTEDKTWWWDHKRRYAIGWNPDAPPCPEDLQRNAQYTDAPILTSFPCRLSDGNTWLVPVARYLPRQWSQGPDGSPLLAAQPAYSWYFEAVRDTLAALESGRIDPSEPPAELFFLAVRALGLSYRICPEVCYATGLFGVDQAGAVVAAAAEYSIEFKAVMTYDVRTDNPILTQKKTASRQPVNAI